MSIVASGRLRVAGAPALAGFEGRITGVDQSAEFLQVGHAIQAAGVDAACLNEGREEGRGVI